MFNYFEFFNPLTKRVERAGMTAVSNESSTMKAMEYIERIRQWTSENYMVELPDPETWKREVRDNPQFIDEKNDGKMD